MVVCTGANLSFYIKTERVFLFLTENDQRQLENLPNEKTLDEHEIPHHASKLEGYSSRESIHETISNLKPRQKEIIYLAYGICKYNCHIKLLYFVTQFIFILTNPKIQLKLSCCA